MIPPQEYFDVRLASRVAGRAAHDLNNLAAVLSGHVYLLREAAEPTEEGLAEIEKATDQIQTLTRSLLALSAIGRGSPADFDPNEVAREAAKNASSAGCVVDLRLDPGVPPLVGSAEDVRRAIEALLSNAREASPPGAAIVLATAAEEDAVIFSIEDTGSGIPPERRERVFEPLFSTRGGRGRGIGLTLASLVAAMHGGVCELEPGDIAGTRALLRLSAG